MSLRSPEDGRPRARAQPQPQPQPRFPPGTGAAPQVVAVADRMGALLLHPQTAALLHVDHSHRVAEPTGAGRLSPDEKEEMDRRWKALAKDPKDDWRNDTPNDDKRTRDISKLKAAVKQEFRNKEGRAEKVAEARKAPSRNPRANLLGVFSGGDGGAAASSGPSARARAAAAGPGPVKVQKPFYRNAYYLQWDQGNDDQDERLSDRQHHRIYKLERHMLLQEDPMIIPYDETWWEPRDDAADGSITMCDDERCYQTVNAIDKAPYFKYERYASADGVSLTFPETSSIEPKIDEYYITHVEQPGNSRKQDYTKTYIERFMEKLDEPESETWYPDARAIYVDAKLFDADEEPLPLYLRQKIFERKKGSRYDRVYVCGWKEIDDYMEQLEGEEWDAAHGR